MISEGSCDTEDRSNDAENSFANRNKLRFKISNRKHFKIIIFQNIGDLLYFWSNKSSLGWAKKDIKILLCYFAVDNA